MGMFARHIAACEILQSWDEGIASTPEIVAPAFERVRRSCSWVCERTR